MVEVVTAPSGLQMRSAIGTFSTGVAVVVAEHGRQPHGMTINSLTSITLEPATMLISLTHGARTTQAVDASGRFSVSILSLRQESIARHFARRGEDKFDGFTEYVGSDELRGIRGALASFQCEVIQTSDVGDHRLFVGQVTALSTTSGEGLAFNAGTFGSFRSSGHEPLPWLY